MESKKFKNKWTRDTKKNVTEKIKKQMEFYFSDANLQKDRFLKKEITSSENGFVDVEMFLRFNKIRSFSEDLADIISAIQSSSHIKMDESGRKVGRVKEFKEPVDSDERTVYVELLPAHASVEWVERVFQGCGRVVYVSLPRFKSTGALKGFAFVEFESKQQAEQACKTMNKPPEGACNRKPGLFPRASKAEKQLEKKLQKTAGRRNVKVNVALDVKEDVKEEGKRNDENVNSNQVAENSNDADVAKNENRADSAKNSIDDDVAKNGNRANVAKNKSKKVEDEDKMEKDQGGEYEEGFKVKKRKRKVSNEDGEGEMEVVGEKKRKKKKKKNEEEDVEKVVCEKKGGEMMREGGERVMREGGEMEKVNGKDDKEAPSSGVEKQHNEPNLCEGGGKKSEKKKNKKENKNTIDFSDVAAVASTATTNTTTTTTNNNNNNNNNIDNNSSNNINNNNNEITNNAHNNVLCKPIQVPKAQLRVISKAEWLGYKQDYLTEQKLKMTLLKGKIKQVRDVIQAATDKKLHSQAAAAAAAAAADNAMEAADDDELAGRKEKKENNRASHSSEVDDKGRDEDGKKKNKDKAHTLAYTEHCIVKVELREEVSKKCLKDLMERGAEEARVAFIELPEGSLEGHVRVNQPKDADAIVEMSLDGVNCSILRGDQEKAYWNKIFEDRHKRLTSKSKNKKRGKDKVVRKADECLQSLHKHKHIIFE